MKCVTFEKKGDIVSIECVSLVFSLIKTGVEASVNRSPTVNCLAGKPMDLHVCTVP